MGAVEGKGVEGMQYDDDKPSFIARIWIIVWKIWQNS